MNENRKYAVESRDGCYHAFGATPEEAVQEYMDDQCYELDPEYDGTPPTEVEVVSCHWYQPQDYTERSTRFAEYICDHLADRIADEAPEDFGSDIIRDLQAEGTAEELGRLLEPVITAWFANLCAGQGGMNWFTTGKAIRLPTRPGEA